jgi:hypothetical protein
VSAKTVNTVANIIASSDTPITRIPICVIDEWEANMRREIVNQIALHERIYMLGMLEDLRRPARAPTENEDPVILAAPLPDEDPVIFAVLFPRAAPQPAAQTFRQLTDTQNIHDPTVAKQFGKIAEELINGGDPGSVKSANTALAAASAILKRVAPAGTAGQNAARIIKYLSNPARLSASVTKFENRTLGELLAATVARIEREPDEKIRREMEVSLVDNLASCIEHDTPVCVQGIGTRMLNTFVGTDPAISAPVTTEMAVTIAKDAAHRFLDDAVAKLGISSELPEKEWREQIGGLRAELGNVVRESAQTVLNPTQIDAIVAEMVEFY